MSGKPLKLSHLIPVKFTLLPDDYEGTEKARSLILRRDCRYKCPITGDILSNVAPCAVLKPTGDVVTVDCVEKIIRPAGMIDPISGKLLKETDIVRLQRGASSFAASGLSLVGVKEAPVIG